MSRNLAALGASAPETTKSIPATEIVCVVRDRQASTTDDAARSATSRMAPAPLSWAMASRNTPLASLATTRTSGLACRASKAISRFSASSSSAQMTACASATPAAARSSGACSVTTRWPALFNSSTIRIPSASSPHTMMWPLTLKNATSERVAAKGEDVHMPTSPKIYVKACINGARTPDQHPNLPVTPERLAAEALAAHGAGAKAVHMHPKAADGVDSLLPQHVDAAVAAVRLAAPGLPLGVTTGVWALPDVDARLRGVDGWTVTPDFVSVNWHEPGSEDLARLLMSKGLGVEVGIFHTEAAESWAASEIARHCMRVMIELQADGDIATADD